MRMYVLTLYKLLYRTLLYKTLDHSQSINIKLIYKLNILLKCYKLQSVD